MTESKCVFSGSGSVFTFAGKVLKAGDVRGRHGVDAGDAAAAGAERRRQHAHCSSAEPARTRSRAIVCVLVNSSFEW